MVNSCHFFVCHRMFFLMTCYITLVSFGYWNVNWLIFFCFNELSLCCLPMARVVENIIYVTCSGYLWVGVLYVLSLRHWNFVFMHYMLCVNFYWVMGWDGTRVLVIVSVEHLKEIAEAAQVLMVFITIWRKWYIGLLAFGRN